MVRHRAFWEDQREACLALIMALTALDQEEPNMSRPAGCVHVFAWRTGDYVPWCRCKTWLSVLRDFVMFTECSFAEVFVSDMHSRGQSSVTGQVIVYSEHFRSALTFGSRGQTTMPWLWTDKTSQQLASAFELMFDCKKYIKAVAVIVDGAKRLWDEEVWNTSIKVAWNTTLVAAQPERGKDKQNKGATRITSGMSFKRGMGFDNQLRGCRIACLRPRFGFCLWRWLLNFLYWNLKWHTICWQFLTFFLWFLLSLIIVSAFKG